MKQLLITIAAVVLVGCGTSVSERALIKAAHSGNIEVAKQAIADGANVNAKNERGGTPLHYAAYHGHKNIVVQTVTRNTFMLVAERQDADEEGKRPVLCFFDLTPEWLETHFRGSFRLNPRYDAQDMMFEKYPVLKKTVRPNEQYES